MESWKDHAAGKVSAQNLVKKTVTRYKQNKDAGTLAVIQWIIDVCNCKYRVQTVESIPDVPKQMENEIAAGHEGFPILNNKKTSTKLCHLMEMLIKKCEHSILYDGFLMSSLCHFLCKLSGSKIRGFRYVSTLAGLSIASELAELCRNVEKQRNNLKKQLNTERDFTVEREVSWQESLISSLNEISENLLEAVGLMQLLAGQIFKHRVKDCSSKIRLFCCEKLKSWVEEYPEIFVSGEYLEIIYVLMHDSLKSIRMCSLKTMESVISTGEPKQEIQNFLSHSKARLIAMTLDVSPEIAVQAIRVLAAVDKFYQSVLNEKDKEQLFFLVFSEHKPVAQEAAGYVLQVSRVIMEEDGSSLLENIACFFKECKYHGYETLYVDSLWDICKELCDWKEFIECFLRQKDTDTKSAFLRIMVSCIHRAVTGETPRCKGKKTFQQTVMTIERSKSKAKEEERKAITEVFMYYLPEIIKQNMKEEIILIDCLKIPLYMQTDIYGCNINQKPLEELLDALKEVVLFTNDDSVLNSVTEVYDLLSSPEVATFNTTAMRCGMLMGTIIDATKKAMENFQQIVQESMPPVAVTYETEKWTKKVSYLSKCIDIRSYDILNEMLQFIAADISGSFPVPDEVMCYMLQSCFNGIKMSVEKSSEADKNSESYKNLINDLQKFIQFLTALMSSNSKTPTQKEAFNIFCELVYFLQVFCRNYPNLSNLLYRPDGYVEDRLMHILNEWVFALPDPSEESVSETTLDERKRMLKGYWSLISCCTLPIDSAEFIFKHYAQFPEYEDCLQQMLQVLLKFDSILCAEVLVNTLWPKSSVPESLKSSKGMAKKFAAVFEANSSECREAVVALQKRVIFHISQHENCSKYLDFMEIFTDFAEITHMSDVDDILEYLRQNVPTEELCHIGESAPFKHYINCLLKVKKSI
ncbi:cohesin subunit SA-2-like isoform X2 [Schistocerca gregaria]|nr:cohesin subunit SA-2-like isoform X2 [Schistocerca gregaria]